MNGKSQDARRMDRHRVSVPGRYRTGSGVAKDVDILDLSETGCRFHDRFGRLDEKTEISLRIATIGPVVSRVRWRDGREVGVEFAQALYGPVFEHIRATLDTRES